MPKPFEDCLKNGGKVRTKDLPNNKYIHICFKGGKSYAGEVKTKQNPKQRYASMIKGRLQTK